MSITGTIAAAFTLYFTGGNVAAAALAYQLGPCIDDPIQGMPAAVGLNAPPKEDE